MKKLNYLLMGLFVASAFTFTSCSSDDEAASADIYYSVNGGSKQVAGAIIEEALGSSIELEATFTMGTNKIEQIIVELDYAGGNYEILDSMLNTGLFDAADKTFTFNYTTNVTEEDKVITLTAIDTKGVDTSFVVTIAPTVESIQTGKIKTSTAKILGGQSNINGSLYSLYLDEVIKLAQGSGMSSSIDLVYYYGSTNKSTLGAPGATATQEVYASISNWSSKNATKFIKLTGVSFDNITTEATFNTAYGTAELTDLQLTNLQVNDIFAILTKKGEKAIIKVKAISAATTAGAITIEVKTVQ